MHTNKKTALPLNKCINHTVRMYINFRPAVEALFYDEKGGKLPIGLSVTKAKTDGQFTVIFQSSDEQYSTKTEFEIPAACLNNIHFRKLEHNLTQESDHKVWRNNLIRNTQPGHCNYCSSFFSSRQQGESSSYLDSAADNKVRGQDFT